MSVTDVWLAMREEVEGEPSVLGVFATREAACAHIDACHMEPPPHSPGQERTPWTRVEHGKWGAVWVTGWLTGVGARSGVRLPIRSYLVLRHIVQGGA